MMAYPMLLLVLESGCVEVDDGWRWMMVVVEVACDGSGTWVGWWDVMDG